MINLFTIKEDIVRRLQHVQPGLPGRGLHHDAGSGHRPAADELERIPGEADGGRGRTDSAAAACLGNERKRLRLADKTGRTPPRGTTAGRIVS